MIGGNRRYWSVVVTCLVLLIAREGQAAIIDGAKEGTGPVRSPDGKFVVSVTPRPVTHLDTIAPADLQLLKTEYPKWTFTTTAAGTGTFNVLQYDPFALTTLGGADFTVLYDDQVATARTDYDWVQIAHPQNWGSRDSKDFVDSKFSNFPFYSNYIPSSLPTLMTPTSFFGPGIWLNKDGKHPQQEIQNPAGGGDVPAGDLLFVDEPFCSYSCVPPGGFSAIDFDLFLVTFTWNNMLGAGAAGTVTILDGMDWGVRIDPAPVSEPASRLLLFALGLVTLTIARRRREPALCRKCQRSPRTRSGQVRRPIASVRCTTSHPR